MSGSSTARGRRRARSRSSWAGSSRSPAPPSRSSAVRCAPAAPNVLESLQECSEMTAPRDDMPPDRNLALELVRVTEAAALQASRLVGMGDKEAADQAAVDGMHAVLHTIHMDGVVVIGEGEKDEAPM